MTAVRVVPPAAEPVSLAELKQQAEYLPNDRDQLLQAYIGAARSNVEQVTGRRLVVQDWAVSVSAFPSGALFLPGVPFKELVSITYTDAADAPQTLPVAGVEVEKCALGVKITAEWPAGTDVVVTYRIGYGAPTDVPEDLRVAIMLLASDLVRNRESSIIGASIAENPAFDHFVWPYRVVNP